MKNTYELSFSHYCFFGVEGGILFYDTGIPDPSLLNESTNGRTI
jgi:hypothetical protein